MEDQLKTVQSNIDELKKKQNHPHTDAQKKKAATAAAIKKFTASLKPKKSK